MIKNFREPFYEVSERDQLNELIKQFDDLQKRLVSVYQEHVETRDLYQRLKDSDLEIEETEKERKERITRLENRLEELTNQERDILKSSRIIEYQRESIELKVSSRYTESKNDDEILSDGLEIIKAVTFDDLVERYGALDLNEWKLADMSDIVCFSYCVYLEVVGLYISYFKETKNSPYLFKIMKRLYDRSLELFPGGFTDQDKKNEYCVFDEKFFKGLKNIENKEFEFDLLTNFKKPYDHRVLPSGTSITAYHSALAMVGTESKQITIDELLESQTVNNMVTFHGLDDSPNGSKLVFNEKDTKKDNVVLTFKNLDNVLGGGIVVCKIFAKCIEKMNYLGYFKRRGIKESFTISVNDLIEDGVYTQYKPAQRALKTAKRTLEELKVSFSNKQTGLELDIPWFSIGWKNKSTLIFIPDLRIEWLYVGQHFTIYPKYIYKLGLHAYRLAYYVFTQARINKGTNKQGDIVFRLRLTTISRELGLPNVETLKKDYRKLILDKITGAVREVLENEQECYGEDSTLELKIESDPNLTAKRIIETGVLVVTIRKSEMTEKYQYLIDSKHDIIETQKRKKAMKKRQEQENK